MLHPILQRAHMHVVSLASVSKFHMWPRYVPTASTICVWVEELGRRPVQPGKWSLGVVSEGAVFYGRYRLLVGLPPPSVTQILIS